MAENVAALLPQWLTNINFATALLAAFLTAFLLSTRIFTTIQSSQNRTISEKGQKPPFLPYWIPIFKSSPTTWRDPSGTLQRAKQKFPGGIFSIHLRSQTKTYIYSPLLGTKFLGPKYDGQRDATTVRLRMLQNGFGMPRRCSQRFLEIWPQVQETIDAINTSFSEDLQKEAFKSIERQMPDLISFSTSQIDAHQWERVSGTVLLEDKETVETGLVALTQTFLAHLTTDQLLSPSLFEQTPDLVALLLTLPSELDNLLNKPYTSAPRGAAVIRTLSTHVQPFLDAVYADEDDQAIIAMFDDVPDAKTPFMSVLRQKDLAKSPAVMQVSILIYLLTMSVVSHVIVPWSLLRLNAPFASARRRYATGVMEAVTKDVSAVQEPGIGSFQPPPEVKVTDKAMRSMALNALLAESILALSRGSTEIDLKDDISISTKDDSDEKSSGTTTNAQRWHLEAGNPVVVVHWLQDKQLEDADWSDVAEKVEDAVDEAFKQLGDFHLPALSTYLKTLYIAFIATFLKLYDIQPADPKGWSLPPNVFATGIALPKYDIRVRIRSRSYDFRGKEVIGTEDKDERAESKS